MGILAAIFSGINLACNVVKTGVKAVWKCGKKVFKVGYKFGRKAHRRVQNELDRIEENDRRRGYNKHTNKIDNHKNSHMDVF